MRKDITAENLLEDTALCNDRSVIDTVYKIEEYNTNKKFLFSAETRIYRNSKVVPSLTCERSVDRFTVSSENGNGDLDYKISLITVDEAVLAGNIEPGYYNATFLSLWKNKYFSLSPSSHYLYGISNIFVLGGETYSDGAIGGIAAGSSNGTRPSISLKNTTLISSGNGSYEQPYIVVTP